MSPYVPMFDYVVKARTRVLDWIRPLSLEQYAREFPYGLKTIHATLTHTASAEWAYGHRLRGRQPTTGDNPLTGDKIKTFAELEAAWTALSSETRRALAETADWDTVVEYRFAPPNAPAVRIRAPKSGIASQLVFHEVHHRAQVMSMLRQLGVAAQNLDYSALMFERRQETA
ncbi:MAG: DinB family protein [Armatimonadota bacterium]|nr:DinB family protein [Armatimonadota bacterium]